MTLIVTTADDDPGTDPLRDVSGLLVGEPLDEFCCSFVRFDVIFRLFTRHDHLELMPG